MAINRADQLWAIIRYEILMSWRRGVLRVILIILVLLVPLFYAIGPFPRDAVADIELLWPENAIWLRTAYAIAVTTLVLVLPLLLVPIMLSEIIPLDRQNQTAELFALLPLTSGVYLAGKVLAFWLALLAGLSVVALGTVLFVTQLGGQVRAGPIVGYWLYGMVPLTAFSTQMGVMLAAGASSRRQALLPGIAAAVLSGGASFVLPVHGYLFAALVFSSLAMLTGARIDAGQYFPDVQSMGMILRIGLVLLAMIVTWRVTLARLRRWRGI